MRKLSACIAVALLAALGGWLALGGKSDGSAEAGQSPTVAAELTSSFKALHPQASAVPEAAAIAGRFPPGLKIAAESVRKAFDDGKRQVYLLAGSNDLCLQINDEAPSSGCAYADSASDGEHLFADVTTLGEGRTRVTVAVPDGVTDLVLSPTGGPSEPMTVRENVAIAIVKAANGTLTWKTADGVAHSMRLLV